MSTLHFLFFKTGPRHTRTLREAAAYLCKQPRCFIDLRDNEGETPLLVACLRKECGFHIEQGVKRGVKLTAGNKGNKGRERMMMIVRLET